MKKRIQKITSALLSLMIIISTMATGFSVNAQDCLHTNATYYLSDGADCSEGGEGVFRCPDCNKNWKETIEPKEHDYVLEDYSDDCTKYYTCSHCNKTKTESLHDIQIVENDTEDLYSFECKKCGVQMSVQTHKITDFSKEFLFDVEENIDPDDYSTLHLIAFYLDNDTDVEIKEAEKSYDNGYSLIEINSSYEDFIDSLNNDFNSFVELFSDSNQIELPDTLNLAKNKTYLIGIVTDCSPYGTLSLNFNITERFESGNWLCRVTSDGCVIEKYTGNEETVEIPNTLNDLNVIGVDKNAFAENESIKVLKINPYEINTDFVTLCENLETIWCHEEGTDIPNSDNYEIKSLCDLYLRPFRNPLPNDCTKDETVYCECICDVCHKEKMANYTIEAKEEHEFTEFLYNDEYYETYKCKNCKQRTQIVHTHSFTEFVEHTDNYDVYKCTMCNATQKKYKEHQHDYKYSYSDDDNEWYVCSICDDKKTAEHNYEKVQEIPATCTEYGYTQYKCANCKRIFDDYDYDVELVGKHNYERTVMPATCVSDEKTVYKCSVCGDSYYEYNPDAPKKLGHTYEDVYYPIENEDYGYTEKKCSRCGAPEEYNSNYYGEFSQYNFEVVDITYPNNICGSTGKKIYRGYYFDSNNGKIPMTIEQPIYNSRTEHGNFEETIIPPKCKESGCTKYKCEFCDYIYTDNYKFPKGHYLTSEVVAPTENTKGYTRYFCKGCGMTFWCNEHYTYETNKWNTVDSYKDIPQDNAVIFKDKNDDYYLMAWNDNDFCNLSYKKNNDGTIKFEIFSDYSTPHIEWDKVNNIPAGQDATEWIKSIKRDELSTAFLYKYSDGKWECVDEEWTEDERFARTLGTSYEKRSSNDYEFDYNGEPVYDSDVAVLKYSNSDEEYYWQLLIDIPQVYNITFDNIKADNIGDVIVWFKTNQDDADNVLFLDRYGDLKNIPSNEVLEQNDHLKNCELCQRIWCLFDYLYSDEFIAIYDQNYTLEYSDKYDKYYDVNQCVFLNQYNPDFKALYDEYQRLINSDEYIYGIHYVFEKNILNLKYWVDEANKRIFKGVPGMINSPKPAQVIANYIDESGNQLAESQTISGVGFDEYKTDVKSFKNYRLLAVPENASGKMLRPLTEVNYIYTLNDAGVIVNYLDEKGEKIAESEIITGSVFDTYETKAKAIENYELVSEPENAKGTMSEETITVNYIYRLKEARVVVKHLDVNGNEVAESEIISGRLFDAYETKAKEIGGYTFVKVEGEASGKMNSSETVITYYYSLNEAQTENPEPESPTVTPNNPETVTQIKENTPEKEKKIEIDNSNPKTGVDDYIYSIICLAVIAFLFIIACSIAIIVKKKAENEVESKNVEGENTKKSNN